MNRIKGKILFDIKLNRASYTTEQHIQMRKLYYKTECSLMQT